MSTRRTVKRFEPSKKWPESTPWVKCPIPGCSGGYPVQDKYEMKRHFQRMHQGKAFEYKDLVQCTYKEWLKANAAEEKAEDKKAPDQAQPTLTKDTPVPSALTLSKLANPQKATEFAASNIPFLTVNNSGAVDTLNPALLSTKPASLAPLPATTQVDLNPTASALTAMASEVPLRKRQRDLRNDPNFSGYGCYFEGCGFRTTGKNALSGHLGGKHGLKQNEKEMDKTIVFNTPGDGSMPITTNNPLRVVNDGVDPGTSMQANTESSASVSNAPQAQRLPPKPNCVLDLLPPPWKPSTSSSQPKPKPTAKDTTSTSGIPQGWLDTIEGKDRKVIMPKGRLPSSTIAGRRRKNIVPVNRAKTKFDHTRLPIFYKCYIDGCNELGRTPESLLKHWKVEAHSETNGNPAHIGHAWEPEKVYKFIRFEDGEVFVTTHGEDPKLPTAEQLDPNNTKQYLPALEHTNLVKIKVHMTDNTQAIWDNGDIWHCNLCYAPIGTLQRVKEHLVDAHFFKKLLHNTDTKMIHFLAAKVDANGDSECYTPEHDGAECGYVGGDILEHLMDEEGHGLDEDDLLDNEKTGKVFLTLAEVKKE